MLSCLGSVPFVSSEPWVIPFLTFNSSLIARTQKYIRISVSATQAGLSLPSISTVRIWVELDGLVADLLDGQSASSR